MESPFSRNKYNDPCQAVNVNGSRCAKINGHKGAHHINAMTPDWKDEAENAAP
jgi:hypothetical protein